MKKIILLFCLLLGAYGLFLQHNVAQLYQVTILDPLFYDPLIDTGAFTQSVQTLQAAEERLLAHIQQKQASGDLTNPPEHGKIISAIMAGGVLPLAYLEQLSVSIKATDTFLAQPNIFTAHKMVKADQKAADQYTKEALGLYLLMNEAIIAESLPFSIQLFASQTTQKQQLSDMALLVKNGEALQQEAKERQRCLWTGQRCPKTVDSKPTSNLQRNVPAMPTELMSKETALYGYGDNNVSGPFLIESGCFPDRFTSFYTTIDDLGRFIAKDAHENYYLDIKQRHQKASTTYLADYQEPYYFQPESTNYRCLDLTYWTDLSVLTYLETTIDNAPTSSVALKQLTQITPTSDTERYLILNNKMVNLPEMFIAVASYLDVYTDVFIEHRDQTELSQLLANRSSYSLTFQPFARSVWRLKQHPRYMTKGNLDTAEEFTTRSYLLENYNDTELQQFHHPVSPTLEE